MVSRVAFVTAWLVAQAAMAQTQPAATLPFETDYQKVMHLLKSPPVTGVLVADVTRDGPGDKAGIQVGDVITSYNGTEIDALATMRKAISEAMAVQEDAKATGKVGMRVVRDGKPLAISVDRGGLDLTPVEVQAGVASRLNPPATPAAELALAWDELLPAAKGGENAVQSARRDYMILRSGDGTALAFMQVTMTRDGSAVESDMKVFTRENPEEATLHITSRFSPSDGKELPVFLMDTLVYDNPMAHFKVQRQGSRLVERGRGDELSPNVTQTKMGVIPLECGIEAVAAAMPHQGDRVLGFSGVESYSLQTRMGYVLVTTGQRKIKVNKDEQLLWGVSEMRFGQVETTWWFDDQRRMVLMEGPDLRAERVASEDVARSFLKSLK